jgi:undecaprenyl diphosphate synthase
MPDREHPRHVAIIMDGNGRWAQHRGLARSIGHERGADAVRRTVTAARTIGIPFLTLYAFSEQNWQRSVREVSQLMSLLRAFLVRERREMLDNSVRLRAIGALHRLPREVRDEIAETERVTSGNRGLTLSLALSYGSREDLVNAARILAEAAVRGDLTPSQIDETTFAGALATSGLPPVDLVIRTSGEQRVSNFLLWELAYAEFYFTPCLWPDFDESALRTALEAYAGRDRRFGRIQSAG